MAFLLIAVSLDMDIAILGVQNLSFGRPGAFIFPPWVRCHYVSLGTLWPAGRIRLGPAPVFNEFGMVLGPHFESSFGSDGLIFLFGLVSMPLFASISNGILVSRSSRNMVFVRKVLQTNMFSQKSFFYDSRLDF